MIYEFKASHCFRTFVYFFAENYSFVGFFLKLKERKFFFSVALFFFVNGLFFLWTRTGERKSTCLRALFESIFKEEFLLSYRSYLFNFLFLFAIVLFFDCLTNLLLLSRNRRCWVQVIALLLWFRRIDLPCFDLECIDQISLLKLKENFNFCLNIIFVY